MAITENRKFTHQQVIEILDKALNKTLKEVDKSNQFDRTINSPKITGIAGDIIEQSVFGYERDSNQECDMIIDDCPAELKTTGLKIPKKDFKKVQNLSRKERNKYLVAKEPISITQVTLNPNIETDFYSSHFWTKTQHILFVFYEYLSYTTVPAREYANFPIVGYCWNLFSDTERRQLQNDWEVVRDYLIPFYQKHNNIDDCLKELEYFTGKIRKNLLLIDLAPTLKIKSSSNGSNTYQWPRYRLKQTFVNTIIKGYFNNCRQEVSLPKASSFNSFLELERQCSELTKKYKGKSFSELKQILDIDSEITQKNFGAICVLKMFNANTTNEKNIRDFNSSGIILKTIKINNKGKRTEDMKLEAVDFNELTDSESIFENSTLYTYFNEHSFLFAIFREDSSTAPENIQFEGFKRFSFNDEFINSHVKKTWNDTRKLILEERLRFEYEYIDKEKKIKRKNKSGSYQGAPNFPKSKDYTIFLRGCAPNSSEKYQTEEVNGIKMIPQYFWINMNDLLQYIDEQNYL